MCAFGVNIECNLLIYLAFLLCSGSFSKEYSNFVTFQSEEILSQYVENDIFFEIVHPEELRYTYKIRQAKDFGSSFEKQYFGISLVISDSLECCSYPVNAVDISGAVVLVARGGCSFVSKALNAEEAGAVGIVVSDIYDDNDLFYIEMTKDNTDRIPSIPAGFLIGKSGLFIMKTLQKLGEKHAIINIPVNASNSLVYKFKQPPWVVW